MTLRIEIFHNPPRGIQVACAQLKHQSKDPYAQPSELIILPCLVRSHHIDIHTVSAPCEGITMLCFNKTLGFPLPAPILNWLLTAQRSLGALLAHKFSPCTNPPSTNKHSSSLCAAQIAESGPLRPTLRANPFPVLG